MADLDESLGGEERGMTTTRMMMMRRRRKAQRASSKCGFNHPSIPEHLPSSDKNRR
jgi:hypothetical protein